MKNKILPINELYSCLQGEGKYAGIPHILVRFTGCRLRCQFANSFCDTSLNSWKPEKGTFTFDDLHAFYKANPQIKHTMCTGGGPTLSGEVLKEVILIAKEYGHHVTIETEGSEYVATQADFISLSPKLSNSTPRPGSLNNYTGQIVTEKHREQHEKWRKNYSAMFDMINNHPDYCLKPVISCQRDLDEVREIQKALNVPNDKVYLMPEGVTDIQLQRSRQWLFELCVKEGYRYSDRLHVIAYGDKRGV